MRELLVASHILPWALSDASQKDDPDNGLVLCVMHDGLFDKGFISFTSDGQLLVTPHLDEENRRLAGLREDMSIENWTGREDYMRRHRIRFDEAH